MTVSMTACGQAAPATVGEAEVEMDLITEPGLNKDEKDAAEYTVQVNSAVYSLLDFTDTSEYENAPRRALRNMP